MFKPANQVDWNKALTDWQSALIRVAQIDRDMAATARAVAQATVTANRQRVQHSCMADAPGLTTSKQDEGAFGRLNLAKPSYIAFTMKDLPVTVCDTWRMQHKGWLYDASGEWADPNGATCHFEGAKGAVSVFFYDAADPEARAVNRTQICADAKAAVS